MDEFIKVSRGEKAADVVLKNGQFLDVFSGEFISGNVAIHNGMIVGVFDDYQGVKEIDLDGGYVVPGFIDSHVHIESSLMTPHSFQKAVLPEGTTTVIWDPHEIANVKGVSGIQWAFDSTEDLALDVFIMSPSCVPATPPSMGLESSGFVLSLKELLPFQKKERFLGLAEVMNFPGVLMRDPDVIDKLNQFSGYFRDGHCPGLSGKDLNAYAVAGISSCHESITIEEAKEKLTKGIHVWIREGSCAKNAKDLLPLLNSYSSSVLGFCSDDRNPLDISESGHIGCVLNMALLNNHKPVDVFRASSFSPAKAYGLFDRGVIAPGYQADLCVVHPRQGKWNKGFEIEFVFKKGQIIDQAFLDQTSLSNSYAFSGQNINCNPINSSHLEIAVRADLKKSKTRVISVIPNQIVTEEKIEELSCVNGKLQSDHNRDLLKIAVFERHHNTGKKSVGIVKGFGLKSGAIATSINHDSHNIIAVGSSDELIVEAINRLISIDGGIIVFGADHQFEELSLPIGGLMTNLSPKEVSQSLKKMKFFAQQCGCVLNEPFLQLSFLALPVIPKLKITDCGLVDVTQFCRVSLLVD